MWHTRGIGEMRTRFWWRELILKTLGRSIFVDGKIILKWILSGIGRRGLEFCGSGQGQMPGAFEGGDETSGSIKCMEFVDQLRGIF
jgi:hypothetical protein